MQPKVSYPEFLKLLLAFGLALSGLSASTTVLAADAVLIQSDAMAAKQASQVYIVQMRDNPIAAYDGSIAGIAATRPAPRARLDTSSPAASAYFD